MKSSKIKKNRKSMSLMKKIVLSVLGLALLTGAIYLTYYIVHYVTYNRYRDFLTSYTCEEGKDFKPAKEAKADVEGMELVCENEFLKLYTDRATANIAVYDKRNGETVYSNPVHADEDSIANASNMNYLKSQFILNYYNKEIKPGTYDSFSMSVERGQIEPQSLENGIRYVYRLGNFEKSKNGTVPIYVTEAKLNEICEKLDEKNATSLRRYFIASTTAPEMLELNGVAQKNVKTIAKIQGWLDAIGWTEEEYQNLMEMAGVEGAIPISFEVSLDYRLDGDGLSVSVPVELMKEYGGGSIYNIQLLRYMGAAGVEETGYMVVPNASGSLIRFNNGKTTTASYAQYVYGIDPLAANYTTTENMKNAMLPLFGICRENSSILMTIEEGKTLAQLTAGVSGVYNDYNYAYPTFVLRTADNLLMFGNSASDVYVLEKDMYDADLTVKYTFLTEENSGYAGLANYYRERLIKEGVLTPTTVTVGDIPFYYDIIGGVKETDHILGVQYLRNFAMTTFDQACTMSDELAEEGITNQVMNYQGWFNGGYYHNAPDQIKVTRKLGGKSGLEDLSRTVAANGGRLYADVSFQNVTFADNGFNWEAESSRYYGAGYAVAFGQVNPTTLRATSGLGYMETRYDLLSPKFLPRYIEKFTKKIDKYELTGISLRDLTNDVHSDKKRTNIINREEALDVVLAQLERLQGTDKKLMGNAASEYSFTYLDDIINVPTMHNRFFIVDEDIPLYQMILHGSISYSGELLNYNDDEDKTKAVLNMIEYGAAPHYIFTWQESSKMKNTGLNRYYATTYETWKPEAVAVYEKVNEALKYVSGAVIINHEIIDEDVRKVTYDNGINIYINYGKETKSVNGIELPAGSYRLEGM